jgi:hypothetical protein
MTKRQSIFTVFPQRKILQNVIAAKLYIMFKK